MALKFVLDTLDGVPEALRDLYTEKDGKFRLSVEGAVEKSRHDEFRDANIALKKQIDELSARFDGIDPDEARKLADRAAKERERKLIDAGKIDEIVAERTKAMKDDAERRVAAVVAERDAAAAERDSAATRLQSLVIDGAIRDAAVKSGVRATAVDDALLRGRAVFRMVDGEAVAMDGDKPVYGKNGDPMGIVEWMGGLVTSAPHLFEASNGAGARGASGAVAGKTMTRAVFEGLDPAAKRAAVKDMQLVD